MIKLGINIDHIATLRQARMEGFPSVVKAALICENAGADGITVHLREDRRHIQDDDVYELRKIIKTKLNMEMAPAEDIVNIALDVKPDSVCLVPEKRAELTTEGGLDVKGKKDYVSSVTEKLKKAGILVSMFVDADVEQIVACSQAGADAVELHTGKYSRFFNKSGKLSAEAEDELKRLFEASNEAVSRNLMLNAGHGLDYNNIIQICKIHGINEFNIGFSIISKAVFEGLEKAVSDMKTLIRTNS
ncbi:MAG: pyridoxine 5'-phosphate synthase [Endomicrobium sp.]|jgi:pyridoxine 5-phosphate synthase|nr:pyridoxine 5'-phosphate synthase [Endomicrobium sp.]